VNSLPRNTAAAFAIGLAIGAPVGMASASSSDHRDFEGTVKHVSVDNIKVYGIEGGKAQTLSFLINPKITKLTHNGGKSTAELKDIHEGDMVKIRFDQKLFGIRHADSIMDETIQMKQKS
jgi:hypothetical protein